MWHDGRLVRMQLFYYKRVNLCASKKKREYGWLEALQLDAEDKCFASIFLCFCLLRCGCVQATSHMCDGTTLSLRIMYLLLLLLWLRCAAYVRNLLQIGRFMMRTRALKHSSISLDGKQSALRWRAVRFSNEKTNSFDKTETRTSSSLHNCALAFTINGWR